MITSRQLKKRALDFIRGQSTMTLATAGDQRAWAAPVYYVLYHGDFYFFSDPESRHMQDALNNRHAAAAIHPHADTWQEIRGIQMSGQIQSAGTGLTAIKALRAYIEKYTFTRAFFEPGQTMDLKNFSRRFKTKFYRMTPDVVYYLDNHIEFGFRKQITLDGHD
jgi:uncharacterized protein YhbP (UPF0306 family)